MKEIVVISGKGGTGKTTISAALADYAYKSNNGRCVTVDCDVDAADLHLILKPEILKRSEFKSGKKAVIRESDCISCGLCVSNCRFGAVKQGDKRAYIVNHISCEGCGVCVRFCPAKAIDFPEQVCGEWYVSKTRFGPFVHARLGIASENSGRLVTLLRKEAKQIAAENNAEFIIVDGSPGIGCPVIASLTAADLALIVTEPTISGEHDFKRIAELTEQLSVPAAVCVNKWDINREKAENIRFYAESRGFMFAGFIPFDKVAVDAQRAGKSVTEFGSALYNNVAANVLKF